MVFICWHCSGTKQLCPSQDVLDTNPLVGLLLVILVSELHHCAQCVCNVHVHELCIRGSHRPGNYHTAIVAVWCKQEVQTACAIEGVYNPRRVGGKRIPLWSQNSCNRYLQAQTHITSCRQDVDTPGPCLQCIKIEHYVAHYTSDYVIQCNDEGWCSTHCSQKVPCFTAQV